jgi:hypothetical protein
VADSFEIPNVNEEQVAALLAKLKATGIGAVLITKGKWQLVGHYINAVAEYKPISESVVVTVSKKPFYITMKQIQDGVEANLKV